MTDNLQPPLSPTLNVGGWASGGMSNSPAMRVIATGDDLIEVVDSTGPLLSLTREEAAALAEELSNVLDIVGWQS